MGINGAKRGRSLDSTHQLPGSSVSKKSRHRKEAISDEHVHTSALRTNDDISLRRDGDGDSSGESSQQLLTPPEDGMFDVQFEFDLPSLDNLSQHTSEQDADEIAQYLPPIDLDQDLICPLFDSPAHQSQDSHLLDITQDPTPTSQHLPTFPTTKSPSLNSCKCLANLVFAVEGFEAACNSSNRAELDSIISRQKATIKSSRSMLECGNCMSKRENIVLLVFMIEKIVAASGCITMLYRTKDDDGDMSIESPMDYAPPSLGLMTPPSSVSEPVGTEFLHSYSHSHTHSSSHDDDSTNALSLASTLAPSTHLLTSVSSPSIYPTAHSSPPPTNRSPSSSSSSSSASSTMTATAPKYRLLHIGDYEITSSQEWNPIIQVLITLQLRALQDILHDMKLLAWRSLNEKQIASLKRAERTVRGLKEDFGEL